MSVIIRPERLEDVELIATVHQSAFPTAAEARLVEALRDADRLSLSLVAEMDGQIVGHVAFSPVTVDGNECSGAGLAPVGVLPDWQRQGIGSALIQTGLVACAAAGYRFVVVLGDPAYYGRFGFQPTGAHGLTNDYTPGPEFMVRALIGGSLPLSGHVRYAPEFAALG